MAIQAVMKAAAGVNGEEERGGGGGSCGGNGGKETAAAAMAERRIGAKERWRRDRWNDDVCKCGTRTDVASGGREKGSKKKGQS